MLLDVIAFDADDTLWDSEAFYHQAQDAYCNLLATYQVERETALDVLHQKDVGNLPSFGYGIKSFTLSMIEAAISATGGRVRGSDIQAIVELGRTMTTHEMRLFEHSAETVTRLAQRYPLMLITKGDLMDQQRKLADSGLAGSFQTVEIVSDKTAQVYADLLRRHGLSAERFLMVGNALRSDILPVLSLGGWAVYVPHALTWVHESTGAPVEGHGRFFEIAHLGLLPGLIDEIERKARSRTGQGS